MTFQCKTSIGTSYLTTASFSAGEDGVRQAHRCIQGLGIGARLSYAAAAVGPFQGTTSDAIQPRFGHASDSLTVHRPAPRFYAQGKTSYQGWSLAISFLSPISRPLAAIINGAAAGSKVVLTITVAYRVTRVGVTRSASCVRPVV